MKEIVVALILAGGFVFGAVSFGQGQRYELIPTPRGTIVLDKVLGEAYQLPALPMFGEPR